MSALAAADPDEPIARLFERMRPLGRHLGPVLYQLPLGWKLYRGRLEHFLQALPRGVRHVLEFRGPSWYADDVFRIHISTTMSADMLRGTR